MPRHSPWDMPLLSNPDQYSNFQSFLQSTTPSVLAQNGFWQDTAECFSLKELWEFYKEWSCFGAGVPILLNSDDSAVQYYSPSLSALQIYARKPRSTSDVTVTSGVSTSDHGHLYFQYNETISPYDRLPFTDKINELAQTYPGLTKFQSLDLSPYSWIAVAWYPIYQIPVARNVKELSACFITYHTLSSFQGLPSTISEEDERFQCINTLGKEHGGRLLERDGSRGETVLPPFAVATYKMYGEFWTNPETEDKEKISSYLDAANSWLKQHKFQHHDFNFFMSRR